ncbi:hypothetical protein [Pseudomonas sp. T1.Ur]|uniref:hypothetical protein n=1 Tax=Pseudomonas sp. T1.Ur TaxID=2928704 RepID=UPI00201D7F3E|nr:hypothetical protein [Pseudomonas sp. T1.Ur]MCL6704191.1 hypothetical protein [Pseudomonas sp. T1.Ur]
MSLEASEVVYTLCGVGVFAFGLIVLIVRLYLVLFLMEEMVKGLSNSGLVREQRGMADSGLVGKFLLLSSISMLLVFPRFSIRRGYLDPKDYELFPKLLKKWIKFVDVSMVVFSMALLVLWAVGKYYGFIQAR